MLVNIKGFIVDHELIATITNDYPSGAKIRLKDGETYRTKTDPIGVLNLIKEQTNV